MIFDCRKCDAELKVEEFVEFECPTCKTKYSWDSEFSYDHEGNIEDEFYLINEEN